VAYTARWACVAAGDDCIASTACAARAQCTATSGVCVTWSDADCARADACRATGKCRFVEHECVAGCRDHTLCTARGMCTEENGLCVASSASDCLASRACEESGECTLQKGHCVFRGAIDCPRLAMCKAKGCFFFEGRCKPKDPCACDFSVGVRLDPNSPEDVKLVRELQSREAACIRAGGAHEPSCHPRH
jgi:hypothetical protein